MKCKADTKAKETEKTAGETSTVHAELEKAPVVDFSGASGGAAKAPAKGSTSAEADPNI